jgi:hypothetical protein
MTIAPSDGGGVFVPGDDDRVNRFSPPSGGQAG